MNVLNGLRELLFIEIIAHFKMNAAPPLILYETPFLQTCNGDTEKIYRLRVERCEVNFPQRTAILTFITLQGRKPALISIFPKKGSRNFSGCRSCQFNSSYSFFDITLDRCCVLFAVVFVPHVTIVTVPLLSPKV